MTRTSATDLLVMHAVRLKGFADTAAIADRFGLDPGDTQEQLLDAQAYGWVSRSAFAGLAGWSLTEAGYRHDETRLREELDRTGARASVTAVHDRFTPANARASQLFTAWQLGPGSSADGTGGLLAGLRELADDLRDLERPLAAELARFAGYHARFTAALARAVVDRAWITGVDVDSCHRVWFEFHEDLIATLGISR